MPDPTQSVMPPDARRPPPDRSRSRTTPLPVVDPHVRVGNAPAHVEPGADALAPLRALLDPNGDCHLLRAVHVQDDLPWEAALADVARVQGIARTPGSGGLPHGIVACADLAVDDVESRLDALTRYPNVRGIRLPAGAALPTSLAPLARRELLLELHAEAVPIGDTVWLASACPDCRLVLDGAGSRADLDRLAPLANVVLKIAHRDPSRSSDARRRLGALVGQAIEAVGFERVVLASGRPTAGPDRPWHVAWRAFAEATVGLPPSRRNALFRTNAVRTYRL